MPNFGSGRQHRRVIQIVNFSALAAATLLVAAPGDSQPAAPAAELHYADIADIALTASVAAHVRIKDAIALDPARAVGVAVGNTRFYVVADVLNLIRAPQSMPAEVAYLADLPNQPDGKAAKLRRKGEFLIFAEPVPGRIGELRLVSPAAQLPYSMATADRLRAILAEAAQPNAAPAIAGIGRAFHVPGSLPGESETQIFLQAEGGRPISLTILRRPGETPRWGVALSEIVDDTAAPPAPDTLLWYRLACTLPPGLPEQSLTEATPDQFDAIRADYRFVLDSLGRCQRSASR